MNRYLYCTGMIILRDCMQQCCDYTEWCYKKTVEWAENLNLPDQGVINALIQEFHLNVKAIGDNGKYGCYPFIGRNCEKATTVHSWGANKFWNNWYLHCEFPVWEDCYQKWLAKGGSALKRQHIPEVSVVIPTYKPDLVYFKQCIDSLLAQELNGFEPYSNYEVIIVAEPFNIDEIKEFIANYNDPRLSVYFNEKRLGIAASLNRGMRLAKGTYIARIDDDDIAAPTRFEQQTAYLNTHPDVDLCTSDYLYFGDMNDGRIAMEGEMAKAWSMLTCPFDHPTLMFKRDFFVENNLFYDEHRGYVEDWELWQRAFRIGMRVGCVHDILLYHRWHNGSAGQTNKTVEMMREMIQTNFKELGVDVCSEDLYLLSPWNGKVATWAEYERLENYFREAVNANAKLKLYDALSLSRAFSMRLSEAKCGTIPELIILRENESCNNYDSTAELATIKQGKFHKIKLFLKNLLKPLYQPIRHRFQDPIIDIQKNALHARIEAQEVNKRVQNIYEDIGLAKQQVSEQLQEFRLLLLQVQNDMAQFESSLGRISEEMSEQLGVKIYDQFKRTQDNIFAKIFEQTENTRQELFQKIYEETENTRQELPGKIYREADDTRKAVENVCNSVELTREETHRHIDFTYRDIMVALERQKSYLPEMKIKLVTDYPVAYKSLDHLYPHGTIRDNTRYPRFIEKCEELLRSDKPLSFLDLGCSGGGMVLEAALREHISMGLEGSDCSQKEQRAEWRLLGNRLQTCDITKPFRLENIDGNLYLFDVITAWEVLEHIAEDDLTQLLSNIRNHLTTGGYFVASIANWADIDPVSGVNWHVTCHPYEWWKNKFENAGFQVCSELFAPIDLPRGGYNPPHCYEAPYPDIDEAKTFHIVVQKNNHERG